MDPPPGEKEEQLGQMDTWFRQEGLGPGSPEETRLSLLWTSFQRTTGHLNRVTRDLDAQRRQHVAEMAEVRKSLEQIRVFTEHKDALAQEIQDENAQLKDQLRRLVALQDAQVSEVAKMLYQQGLTELIPSSCSEQVAYLLVERASLLEMTDVPAKLTCDENTEDPQGAQGPNSNTGQTDARHFTGRTSSVEGELFRLERDLEEGSRRLATAHSEIRRLTEELESAHLTQRAYEPEVQGAQQEVEQLRQEVGKLKKYEMVGLRKAKEMNDRLDLEIRALRNRVRSLDAEKSSLQDLVVRLQKEVEQLRSEPQEQQKVTTVQVQVSELAKVTCLQREVQWLELALQEQQQENLTETTNSTGKTLQYKLWKPIESQLHQQLQDAFTTRDEEQRTQTHKECFDNEEAGSTQTSPQDECKALKKEICEALRCLDTERSKYHEMKVKHEVKLSRAKQKLDEETTWRDEKIKSLERDLSLCSHSLAKEKEIVGCINRENEKLLVERRKLLQHLNEEEHSKKQSTFTACLSKCRVEFLEMENKKLRNQILHMSEQLGVLERTLQNMQPHHFAEEPVKVWLQRPAQQLFSQLPLQTPSVMTPGPSEETQSSHTKQTNLTPSPTSGVSADLLRPAEMGYLNLASTHSSSSPPAANVQRASVSEVFHQSEAACNR